MLARRQLQSGMRPQYVDRNKTSKDLEPRSTHTGSELPRPLYRTWGDDLSGTEGTVAHTQVGGHGVRDRTRVPGCAAGPPHPSTSTPDPTLRETGRRTSGVPRRGRGGTPLRTDPPAPCRCAGYSRKTVGVNSGPSAGLLLPVFGGGRDRSPRLMSVNWVETGRQTLLSETLSSVMVLSLILRKI